MKINKKLIKYLKNNDSPDFIKYFYGIFISKKDMQNLNNYSKVVRYGVKGFTSSKISTITGISKRKIEHWIYDGNKPFIIRLLEHYLNLGEPKNNLKWLSINSTRGGLLTEPWIQVPAKIKRYQDIQIVLNQLDNLSKLKQIDYSKEYLFAYLLGFMIGDSSKTGIKRKQRVTRRIHIRLSKAHKTNETMGNFVSLCANNVGLRMGQRKDCPAGKRNVYPFYTWISQSSHLIQWIFNVCLGLKDDELTTYDSIKSNWILESPRDFKICFLQGLADSDGFVDFSSQQIGIITEPNTLLIKDIFDSLGIKSTKRFLTHSKLWTLMISIKDAHNLPIFNPYIQSYRYNYVSTLFKAKKISGHWPIWLVAKIEKNIKEGCKGTKLVKKILNEDGIRIRIKSINWRANKMMCLGIESTAL